MSAVEISYKGSQIASMDATGVKTLLTGDTFCEDDIVIQYTAPSAPTPTGTKQITISGAGTVTEDVTNYANAEITTPSGTAGTPTATKGVVSNHSVSVTPSVTNATGFITGSTKTGAAVTVSASELVSGSETKTENGTYDVTNLAELIVNVSGGGGSSNYETGEVTLESDVSVTGSNSVLFPNLQMSFQPDLFILYVPRDVFAANVTIMRGGANYKGVFAIKKTLFPSWQLDSNVSTESTTSDYVWIRLSNVSLNSDANGGYALNGIEVLNATYAPNWKLESNGTFKFGAIGVSTYKFRALKYRYFAMKIS